MNQIINNEETKENEKKDNLEAKVIEEEKVKQEEPNKTQTEKEEKQPQYEQKPQTNKTHKKMLFFILIPLILLGILSVVFALLNINNEKILTGIKINNIDVKALTIEEAISYLKSKMNENETIVVNVDGRDYTILKENLNIEYNFADAVEKAYMQGRENNIFINNFSIVKNMLKGKNIEMEVKISENGLQDEINKINSEIPEGLTQNTYYIEEDNLIIKRGAPGNGIDLEQLREKIFENITQNISGKILMNSMYKEPEDIDIEKIRNEIYVEPQNAFFEKEPFTVHEHVNGIDIDIEKAKEILKEDKDEYIIPLVITKPSITTDQIGTEAFPNLLGKCTTKYDESNVSRSTNLKVACRTLNGKVVNPGETFSYNKTLGERTYAKGYRLGGGYVGGRTVDMIGGGICQISSTLYNAVLYANLGIVERHAHAHIAAYLDPGRDATVAYGSLDFKFKNTRNYPIMIKASAKNGIATIEIYGLKEEQEYEIEIISKVSNYIGFRTIYEDDPTKDVGYEKVTQKGMRGCNSTTYKVYKLNGVEVKREVLSNDHFDPMHKYITRGTKGASTNATENTEVPANSGSAESETPEEQTDDSTTPATPEVPETPTVPEVPDVPSNPGNENEEIEL